MKLSNEDKDELKEIAAALMTDEQICVLMRFDFDEYRRHMLDPTSDVYQIVNSARLSIQVGLNHSIIRCAIQGSSPAQLMAQKLQEQLKLST